MKGLRYYQAHHPGREGSYGLQPWLHGRRCKFVALSTGERCKRAVMRGYDVCPSHGGKAGDASKAVMAAPYDPVAAMERQVNRARHHAYARLGARWPVCQFCTVLAPVKGRASARLRLPAL